jgi:hypothetical protein
MRRKEMPEVVVFSGACRALVYFKITFVLILAS